MNFIVFLIALASVGLLQVLIMFCSLGKILLKKTLLKYYIAKIQYFFKTKKITVEIPVIEDKLYAYQYKGMHSVNFYPLNDKYIENDLKHIIYDTNKLVTMLKQSKEGKFGTININFNQAITLIEILQEIRKIYLSTLAVTNSGHICRLYFENLKDLEEFTLTHSSVWQKEEKQGIGRQSK